MLSRKILFQLFVACRIGTLLGDGRREQAGEYQENNGYAWNLCDGGLPDLEVPRFNARSAAEFLPAVDNNNSEAPAIVKFTLLNRVCKQRAQATAPV